MGAGLTQNHEVIGITHEAKAALVELPVQIVEDDVGQQGTDDPPLGGARRCRLEDALFHHSGAKKLLNQAQDVAVRHLCGQSCHDDRMGQVIEKPLDVGIQDNPVLFPMEF